MNRNRFQILSYAAIILLFICVPTCFAQDEFVSKTETERASLKIAVNVPSASVYLNDTYAGTTPLIVTDLVPGTYRISIRKNGYETKNIYADITAGTEKSFYIELQPITGILQIDVTPTNALIYIDGEQKTSSSSPVKFELTEGVHSVEIRAFGYRSETQTVYIPRKTISKLDVTLKKTDFSASSLRISPATFNPLNPGVFGTCNFNFSVTAPGSGIITVSKDGSVVKTIYTRPFTTWTQSYAWNGKTDSGTAAPDGTYLVTAELTGKTTAGEDISEVSSAYVTIDRSISYPFASISASGTGTGLVSSALLYPAGTMYTALNLGYGWKPNGTLKYGIPFIISFMHTPLSWLEYSIQAGFIIPDKGQLPLHIGGAVKAVYGSGAFKAGALLRYGYNTEKTAVPGTDAQAGLGIGVTAGYTIAPVSFNVSSECIFGPEQGIITDGTICWKNGTAVRFTRGNFSAGIWGAIFSAFNMVTEPSQDWYRGTAFGADVLYVIPDTPIMLGLQGMGTICPGYDSRIAISLECTIFLR